MEDNSHAGQGAVVLDIGGDVGALVIVAPAELEGVEIEARPLPELVPGLDRDPGPGPDHGHGPGGGRAHEADHGHGHGHGPDGGHDHGHDHGHGHSPGSGHLVHVAVVPRPVPGGRQVHSAVFGALPAGTYELYERPAGPVRLTAEVRGGAVTDATWPA